MSIDDRVVELSFDNKQFEAAVATTMQTLAKLQQSLQFPDVGKGLGDISKHFDANPLATSIDSISGKFLALATIGVTALTRITDAAISAGVQLVKSLTITPITAGLHEYETNLNAVQTILANTQASGATLKDVNAALQELNEYSDKTIYNFSEMARNIGTFTAAGVDLKTSTEAIKGIANLAALSGSNSQQASTAMYQLSQAISSGKVGLQDWNSVVNAGMGGTVFQRALAQTAVKMGTLSDDAVKLKGKMKNVTIENQSFRNSLTQPGKDPWLTKEVLTKTLSQFTGDLTDAQLAAEGFSKAEIKAIQQQARTAQQAATNVKTLSQVIDVARETAGSGWAETWQIIFGDFGQAKKTFTQLSNAVNGVINNMADARNALLEGWAALGGRKVAIQAIKDAFKALGSVLKPIHDAFREIFPAKTSKDLYNATVAIRDFFRAIKLGPEQMENLKRTFAGLFAILDIGKQILSGVAGFIGDLFSQAGKSSGGILEFTGNIGDFLVHLDDMIKKGGYITHFFDKLSEVIKTGAHWLGIIGDAIAQAFDGRDKVLDASGDALERIGDRLSPIAALFSGIQAAFAGFADIIKGFAPVLGKITDAIGEAFGGIGQAIADSVANGNYSAALDTINTALFGGFIVLFKKFTSNGIFGTKGGGMFKSISKSFDSLTGTLKSMQTQIQAKSLLMIAGAVALLTVSLVALSLINSAKLTKALAAMTVAFGELIGSLAIMGQIGGVVRIPILAASLVLLAGAMLIMAAALKVLSTIPFGDLVKGLTAFAGILVVIAAGMALMPSDAIARTAASLILLGVALNLIAVAMKIFATMSWQEMGKGLVAVAGALGGIALGMSLMPGGMLRQAAALVLIAGAMNVLAGALKIMATMSWKEIGKSLAALAGSLIILAVGLAAMEGTLLGAAALIVVSGALVVLAGALKIMGSMDWEEIAKSMVTLAGSLLILAGGLYLMSGTLLGSAALLVAAAALRVLAPVLATLGELKWTEIAKGLAALAAVFIVLGLAALALSPVIAQLVLLGVAVALIGAGLALAGLGVLAFATALTALIAAGSLGAAALTAIFATIIGLIPTAMMALQLGLIALAGAIGAAAPAIIEALVKILISLMDAIIRLTPKIKRTLGVLIDAMIDLTLSKAPALIKAGTTLIIMIMTGIEKAIPKIAKKGADIIIAFMDAIAKEYPRIIDGAFKAVIKLIDGVSDAIDANSAELGAAGGRLAASIIQGMITGIASGAGAIGGAMKDMAGNAINSAKNALHINSPSKDFIKIGKSVNEGFIKGVVGGKDDVVNAMHVISDAIKVAVQNSAQDIASLKGKLKDLNSRPKTASNKKEIAKTEAALKAAEKAHSQAVKANVKFTKGMKEQRTELVSLGKQYDKVTAKLDKAKQKLADAIKERDDFKKSIIDQYSVLPEIDATTSLDNYFDAIRKATEDNIKFKATLDQLRDLGLDDTSYKKFLAEGVESQPFLDALLAAGGSAVTELNNIDASLTSSATDLGKTASTELYQAGVDAAQGLVDGLEKQMDKIIKQMEKIGTAMAKAIKKELGIKSPSRVFAEIGKQSNEGLAKGLDDSADVVDISAGRVGQVAIDSLKKSMEGLPDALSGDLDMTPVIAPVLDLDSFRKDATAINDILKPNEVVPNTSTTTAKTISATQQARADAAAIAGTDTQDGVNIEFKQYNTSPKALSTADIYRQSKNQLSVLKEVVKSA